MRILLVIAMCFVVGELYADKLPDKFTAKVVAVSEGDLVRVLLAQKEYVIRISGIDAPELSQPFGKKAKEHLSKMIFGKHVAGVTEGVDRYGRNICTLKLDGKRVDFDLLKHGFAWHYLRFSSNKMRSKLEERAKLQKLGLWRQTDPASPWEWRMYQD